MKKLESLSSKLTFIENIIYFEDDDGTLNTDSSRDLRNWTIASIGDVEKLGKEDAVQPSLPSKESIALVMYTSGSTGLPKVCYFILFSFSHFVIFKYLLCFLGV